MILLGSGYTTTQPPSEMRICAEDTTKSTLRAPSFRPRRSCRPGSGCPSRSGWRGYPRRQGRGSARADNITSFGAPCQTQRRSGAKLRRQRCVSDIKQSRARRARAFTARLERRSDEEVQHRKRRDVVHEANLRVFAVIVRSRQKNAASRRRHAQSIVLGAAASARRLFCLRTAKTAPAREAAATGGLATEPQKLESSPVMPCCALCENMARVLVGTRRSRTAYAGEVAPRKGG